MGISNCAPWIPWIKCPEARIIWGIGAGCWDPIRGLEDGIAEACGECGWRFMIFVMTFVGVSGTFIDWVLLGVWTAKINY